MKMEKLNYETGLVSIENSIANFRCGEIRVVELIQNVVWGVNLIIAEKALIQKIEGEN
jgi:hypothetical protein